jgi:hypothetical protein
MQPTNNSVDSIVQRALDDLATTRSPAAIEAIVRRAVHEAYRLGRADALAGLITATELSQQIGVSRSSISRAAHRLGVGLSLDGRLLLLDAEGAELVRQHVSNKPGRRPKPAV